MTPDLGAYFATYVPSWIRASVVEVDPEGGAPSIEAGTAAVLLLDIAGFTEITDRLAQKGESGAEQLSVLLNDCFAILTEVVDAHGGDIAVFTGDGFIALWEATECTEASRAATQCALALREAMDGWAHSSGSRLRQRISVDVGTVYYCRLGGHGGAWRYAVVGTPFQKVGSAYRKAAVGQVLVCEAAWRAIAEHCEGEPGDGVYALDRLKSALKLKPRPAVRETAALNYQSLIPTIVVDRLGTGGPKWLAEFRSVSVICINLLGAVFDGDLLNFLQPCILKVQQVAADLEGVIFGVWMDDKGICIGLVFGAPPLAHEEDPLRAVEAGLRIQKELRHGYVRASIGIGSGKLFCGDYGGRSRRDYGLLGPAMNTAARLMEMADGGFLCDAATAQAVGDRVSFSVLQSQRLKGRPTPVPVYRPIGMLTRQQVQYPDEIVGRDRERRELRTRLEQVKAGMGGLVIIQGEPGIGKSRLLSDFAKLARDEGVPIAQGRAAAIDRTTPYFAWRQVLSELIEPEPAARNRLPQEILAARLQHEPALTSWLPLLADILPIALAETPLTEQITGAARAASIEALVVELLLHSANSARVIVFEDLHWFDEASLSLLESVLRRLPHLLVIASRRSSEPMVTTGSRVTDERILEISLGELPTDAATEVIRRRLRATQLSPALVSFVQARAGGNPFYCEELVSALREAGAISLERGVCLTSTETLNSANMSLPASLEGAIVTRVDALRPHVQLLLKVASAFGGPFTAEVLQGVYPGAVSLQEIDAMLDHLVERELLRVQENGAQYEFRHAISEGVTYSLLPFAQRRLLHAGIASALEGKHAGRLEPYYGQLARHWERADDKARAIDYLELAADQSLRSYANHDAIQYIQRAFELGKESRPRDENERFSRWEAVLGDAYNELADYDQSLPHYERALSRIGQRIARNRGERTVALINNLAVQAWLRLVTPRHVTQRAVDRQTSQRVAHIRERLAERHFFRNESAAVLDETLAAVNTAERGGAVTEMISGYSALSVGLGMSGLRGPARFYQNRAMSLAARLDLRPEAARAYLLAAVLGYGLGEWESTERFARRALSLYRQLGDRARAQTPLTVQLSACILRGDLEQADQVLIELRDTTIIDSTGQGKAWRLAAQVMLSTIRGIVDADDLGQLNEVADTNLSRADQLLCLGTVASGFLRRGEMSNALVAAERGLLVLRETGTVWGNYIYGVSGVIEVLQARWSMESKSVGAKSDAREKALLACKCARRATRASPVCRPQSLLLNGRAAFLSGRTGLAGRMWTKAAASAERFGMRRELGLALYEIGCMTTPSDPRRALNLSRATEIFEAMGAKVDLAAARRAMSA
jgi:class 3 adenylate cyclase/tetratricopeptide (TPR) repeat protein